MIFSGARPLQITAPAMICSLHEFVRLFLLTRQVSLRSSFACPAEGSDPSHQDNAASSACMHASKANGNS